MRMNPNIKCVNKVLIQGEPAKQLQSLVNNIISPFGVVMWWPWRQIIHITLILKPFNEPSCAVWKYLHALCFQCPLTQHHVTIMWSAHNYSAHFRLAQCRVTQELRFNLSVCISKADDALPLRAEQKSQTESIVVYPQQFCWIFRGSRLMRIFREWEKDCNTFFSAQLHTTVLGQSMPPLPGHFYLHGDQSPRIPLTNDLIRTPPRYPPTLIFNYTLLNVQQQRSSKQQHPSQASMEIRLITQLTFSLSHTQIYSLDIRACMRSISFSHMWTQSSTHTVVSVNTSEKIILSFNESYKSFLNKSWTLLTAEPWLVFTF